MRSQKSEVRSQKLEVKRIFVLIFGCALILASSCKMKYGFKGQTIPAEAKTISVITFKNQADLTPPAEIQSLSQRLRDAVSSQTNLALIKQNGDLRFEECKIVSYSYGPQSIGTGDVNQLNRLTVTISLDYVNSFDASKSFQGKTFTRYYDYDASKTLTQVEGDALDQINRQLVEDIFNAAFNNW
jgi:hypothetical protein